MKLIKTDDEHRAAMTRLEELMILEPEPGTVAADELEVLALLIETYEKTRFPISAPHPVAAILFRMEQLGLSRTGMQRYLGTKSRVSEVLAGKRPLSLAMIRKLHSELRIPASALLELPATKRAKTPAIKKKSARLGRSRGATSV